MNQLLMKANIFTKEYYIKKHIKQLMFNAVIVSPVDIKNNRHGVSHSAKKLRQWCIDTQITSKS